MEKLFQLMLQLIHKVPWTSEWEQTGAHAVLAEAWDEVAEKLGIDTAAEDYVAPISPPAADAPSAAPAPLALDAGLDYAKLAAALLKASPGLAAAIAGGEAPAPPAPAPSGSQPIIPTGAEPVVPEPVVPAPVEAEPVVAATAAAEPSAAAAATAPAAPPAGASATASD
jgi:hypothetical protein